MTAVVVPRYGPPEMVGLRDIADPVPGMGEFLIAVRVSTVTAGDWPRRSDGHRVIAGVAAERPEALAFLMELAAKGILTPPIDCRLPLSQIAATHARVQTRRKRGHVIINMGCATGTDLRRHTKPCTVGKIAPLAVFAAPAWFCGREKWCK